MKRASASWVRVGVGAAVSALLLVACFIDEEPQATSASDSASSSMTDPTSGTTGTTSETSATTTGTTTTDPPPDVPVFTCPDVPDLVLCYEFESGWDDGLLIDTSNSLLHGSMLSAAKVAGHSGAGAQLTAESRIFSPFDEEAIQRLLNAFTVAAWIRPNPDVLSGTRGVIEREGHIRLALIGNGKTYEVSCTSPGLPEITSSLNLQADEWVHVACIYDGASLSVWVGGKKQAEMPAMINQVGDDPLWIGNDGPAAGASTALLGLVDEVQLWGIALSPQALCEAAGIADCS